MTPISWDCKVLNHGTSLSQCCLSRVLLLSVLKKALILIATVMWLVKWLPLTSLSYEDMN